jgi:CRP/FNR family transcriptional regulator
MPDPHDENIVCDLLAWVDEDAAKAFRAAVRTVAIGDGTAVYRQGDRATHLYRILSGEVRLTNVQRDGSECLYALLVAGDCFGEGSLIDDTPRLHTAQARGAVRLEVLSHADLARLRRCHPAMEEALMRLLARHMRMANRFLSESRMTDLKVRVAHRLHAIAGRLATDGGYIGVSQSELAMMLGISRQSINQALSRLRTDGLISTSYSRIRLLEPAALGALEP